MKNENHNKSKVLYDIESDKSKGIGLKGLAQVDSPKFTKNEKGEIEFEIEIPTQAVDVEDDFEETSFTEDDEGQGFYTFKNVIKIIIISLIIISIVLVIWALNSDTFNITKITLDETSRVNREAIMQLVSGEKGNNIFLINTGSIEKRIEKMPYVFEATIKRNLPDEIEVAVSERTEYISISGDNKLLYIDQYGYIMSEGYNEGITVPHVNGLSQGNYSIGDTLKDTDLTKFKGLKYFLETAKSVAFEYGISNIDYSNANMISFAIDDLGINVMFGEMEEEIVSDKLNYLSLVIKECIDRNFKGNLDISAENYLENTIFEMKI